jgi:hypothetical protein
MWQRTDLLCPSLSIDLGGVETACQKAPALQDTSFLSSSVVKNAVLTKRQSDTPSKTPQAPFFKESRSNGDAINRPPFCTCDIL